MVSHVRYAFSRHSSSHCGSCLRSEIARTTSSLSPGGNVSASTSVTKPYLYSLDASCSMVSVDVLMMYGCAAPLCAERRAAAARALRVWILEEEPLAHEVRVVIEHRVVEQAEAARIDEDPRVPGSREHAVVGPRLLLPAEHVLVPGAPARAQAHAQPSAGELLLRQHLHDLLRGVLGNLNHGCIWAEPGAGAGPRSRQLLRQTSARHEAHRRAGDHHRS